MDSHPKSPQKYYDLSFPKYIVFHVTRSSIRVAVQAAATAQQLSRYMSSWQRYLWGHAYDKNKLSDEKIEKQIDFNANLLIDFLLQPAHTFSLRQMMKEFEEQEQKNQPLFRWHHLLKKTKQAEQNPQVAEHRYRFYLFCAQRLADPQSELSSLLSKALSAALLLDKQNNSHKCEGDFEKELQILLSHVGLMISQLEGRSDISGNEYWEKLASLEPRKSSRASSPSSPQPEPEEAQDIIRKVMRSSLSFFKKVYRYFHDSTKDDGELQHLNPELIALSQFSRKEFVQNHLRDLPQILNFISTLLQKPPVDDSLLTPAILQEHQRFQEGLYKMLKGLQMNAIHSQPAFEWLDTFAAYLKYESLEGSDLAESNQREMIASRNKAREHLIVMAIHQFFPELSIDDFDIFKTELEYALNNMPHLIGILGHLRPALIAVLRKKENQPYARTLIAHILHNSYGYDPAEIAEDIRLNQQITSPLRERISSHTQSQNDIDLPDDRSEDSQLSQTLSIVSEPGLTTRQWAEPQEAGGHFADDLAHFVLSSSSFTPEQISSLLASIHQGDTLAIFRQLFCKNEQAEYHQELLDHLIHKNPVGVLRFVSKILIQIYPPDELQHVEQQTEKMLLLQQHEKELHQQLCHALLEPIETAEYRLSLLVEGLADISHGQHSADVHQIASGINKIIVLLPAINNALIQKDPPSFLIAHFAKQLWPINQELSDLEKEQEKILQLKIIKIMIDQQIQNVSQDPSSCCAHLARRVENCALSDLLTHLFIGDGLGFLLQNPGSALLNAYDLLTFEEQKMMMRRMGPSSHILAVASVGRLSVGFGMMAVKGLEAFFNYGVSQTTEYVLDTAEQTQTFIRQQAPLFNRLQDTVAQSCSKIEWQQPSLFENIFKTNRIGGNKIIKNNML